MVKKESIYFRAPNEIKALLEKLAEINHRSISAEALIAVTKHINDSSELLGLGEDDKFPLPPGA